MHDLVPLHWKFPCLTSQHLRPLFVRPAQTFGGPSLADLFVFITVCHWTNMFSLKVYIVKVHLPESQNSPERRESSLYQELLQSVGKQNTLIWPFTSTEHILSENLPLFHFTLYFFQKMRVQIVLLVAAFVAVASALPVTVPMPRMTSRVLHHCKNIKNVKVFFNLIWKDKN